MADYVLSSLIYPFCFVLEDEDINLTEEMIADLIEELTVDMTPRPGGWSAMQAAYNSVEQANQEAEAAAAAEANAAPLQEDADDAREAAGLQRK